jgi:hypothetical protein
MLFGVTHVIIDRRWGCVCPAAEEEKVVIRAAAEDDGFFSLERGGAVPGG